MEHTKTVEVIRKAIERQKRIRDDLTQAAHLVGMAVVDSNANQLEPLSRLAERIYAQRAEVDTLLLRLADALAEPEFAARLTLGDL